MIPPTDQKLPEFRNGEYKMSHSTPAPSTSAVVRAVVLNTNVQVGDAVLHVQTEQLASIQQLITCVLHEGQVLARVSRSYAKHANREDLQDVLSRVAASQHKQQVEKASGIWKSACNKSEELPVTSDEAVQQAFALFELGLTLVRTNPQQALDVWDRAHALDPSNRACLANLNMLAAQLSEKVHYEDY
jgi:hypothetical protein